MRRPTYEESMEWFTTAVPELGPLLAQHVADQGEVLPYVLFEDDFMGWFKSAAKADPENPSVTRFLDCVEVLLDGPADEASNLAFIGFVEHLVAGGEDAVLAQLGGRFGPATDAAFKEFRRDQVRLGELRREFGRCRCRDLDKVVGEATSFYRQHLVWIDVIQAGLEILQCPDTRSWWSSSDARFGGKVEMRRHADEAAAEQTLRAALRST